MTPLSDCQVRDPRIRRTRKLLQGALETLLHSQSFDEISVQDITEAATLNRATFYDHYTDKFALLEAMIAGRFHELLDERNLSYETGCPGALAAIVQAVCDFLPRVHSGESCRRQAAMEPLMDAAMTVAIQRLLLEGLERAHGSSFAMVAAAAGWAICGGVKQWYSDPGRPPVKTFVPRLVELILPLLEAGSKAESAVPVAVHLHP